ARTAEPERRCGFRPNPCAFPKNVNTLLIITTPFVFGRYIYIYIYNNTYYMKSYLYIGRWYSNEFRVVISFFTMVLYAITMDQVITLHIPPIITYIYIYIYI
ncbi:hypothetical protein FWK35_00009038, partial [Aphis craccivora]